MKRDLDLPPKVWGYIDQCLASGIYGENVSETVLSLMRGGGLEQAHRIGIVDLRATPKKSSNR